VQKGNRTDCLKREVGSERWESRTEDFELKTNENLGRQNEQSFPPPASRIPHHNQVFRWRWREGTTPGARTAQGRGARMAKTEAVPGEQVRWARQSNTSFSVTMARGNHLFPSRTQQLSLSASMVLVGRPAGRVERCRELIFKTTHEQINNHGWFFEWVRGRFLDAYVLIATKLVKRDLRNLKNELDTEKLIW
jgi:hypothetical protein